LHLLCIRDFHCEEAYRRTSSSQVEFNGEMKYPPGSIAR
jgi:hypothetical protein